MARLRGQRRRHPPQLPRLPRPPSRPAPRWSRTADTSCTARSGRREAARLREGAGAELRRRRTDQAPPGTEGDPGLPRWAVDAQVRQGRRVHLLRVRAAISRAEIGGLEARLVYQYAESRWWPRRRLKALISSLEEGADHRPQGHGGRDGLPPPDGAEARGPEAPGAEARRADPKGAVAAGGRADRRGHGVRRDPPAAGEDGPAEEARQAGHSAHGDRPPQAEAPRRHPGRDGRGRDGR
jgi:hypothetical protein